MLVLVGTKRTLVQEQNIKNCLCNNCNIKTNMILQSFSSYAYITFIPLFPTGKEHLLTCLRCDTNVSTNQLSKEKLIIKNPLWTYFGVFLLAIVAIYFLINLYKTNSINKDLISNPQKNDVYFIEDSKGYYSTFKINQVTTDSIFATQNNFQVNLPFDIESIDLEENYTDNKIRFSKKELQNQFNENLIKEIKRENK